MPRTQQQMPTPPAFSPNVKARPQECQLTTGYRCLGWLLAVWPVAGALSISIPAVALVPQLTGWDYLIWLCPLVLTSWLSMLCSPIPGYALAWGLCTLGDLAERRGMPKRLVWFVVAVLCAMAGAGQLSSVQGCWQELHAWGVRGVFLLLSLLLLWGLMRMKRALIPSATLLRCLYACVVALNLFLGGAYLLHRQSAPDIQGNEPKLHYADWGNVWRYKGPGFNPLNPTGDNKLITYTRPGQCPDLNRTLLQTLLGTPPPEGTEIRGHLGYTNSELLIFARTPQTEAEKWLADRFPGCEWQPMDRHTSFRILEYEYSPAQYTPCFYTRLPDIDGAQRYIIRPQDDSEWIYLRLTTP